MECGGPRSGSETNNHARFALRPAARRRLRRKGCRRSLHNRAVPWQRASARSFALHGQSVWLTSDQLSPTCCKIVSTTIQCAIDNAEKTIATGAPGGAQAAIWTLIASSFQNLPLARHANRKFILIFGIVQWHVSGSRHCGTALTS